MGQLGDGTTSDRNTPTQILSSGSVAQIAAGSYHSLILKNDGSLHAFGFNDYGQLGDGTSINRSTPTQILSSGVSSNRRRSLSLLIIKTDGSLHAFGRNDYGQLGDSTSTNRSTPTQILSSGVAQIAAGANHSLILKNDGSLHAFGWNPTGQLGDGTTSDRNTPTQILSLRRRPSVRTTHPLCRDFHGQRGSGGAPYYTFTDSLGNTPDMTNFTFHKGSKYLFTANNISSSHPFRIGSARGVDSTIVNGGTLTSAGNGHQIIVNIPHDFAGTLVYYCVAHSE